VGLQVSLERKAANLVEVQVKTEWLDERYSGGRVYVAFYEDGLSQQVKAGENRGELLKHDRVVRHLSDARKVSPRGGHWYSGTHYPPTGTKIMWGWVLLLKTMNPIPYFRH